jgi:tetratricopeptide (TPR) repeat protein
MLRWYKGLTSFKNFNFISAIELFTDALKFDENNYKLFFFRAKCYVSMKLYYDAIIDLLEVEKLNNSEKIAVEIKEMRREIGKNLVSQTNYGFLEIPRTATNHEIARSFASLKLLHKVNLGKASTEAEKRKIVFKFKRVEKAFAVLSDKKFKMQYDKQLADEEAQPLFAIILLIGIMWLIFSFFIFEHSKEMFLFSIFSFLVIVLIGFCVKDCK